MIFVTDTDIELPKFMYTLDGFRSNAVVAIPWNQVPRLFHDTCRQETFDDQVVQRNINKTRVKKLAQYLEERILGEQRHVIPPVILTMLPPDDDDKYSGSALDKDYVSCIPYNNSVHNPKADEVLKKGTIIVVNDGQHRIEAIKLLLKKAQQRANKKSNKPKYPELNSKIGVNYRDAELIAQVHCAFRAEEMQQIFADINANASKPSKSISMFFDKASPFHASVAKLIDKCLVLRGRTDIQKNVPGGKSPHVFSVATVTTAIQTLFPDKGKQDALDDEEMKLANTVFERLDYLWRTDDEYTAEQLRAHSLGPHAVFMQGVFNFMRGYIEVKGDAWNTAQLRIPFDRMKPGPLTYRCAMHDGTIIAGTRAALLTSAKLKELNDIPLTPAEHAAEQEFKLQMAAIADMEKARKK